MVCFSILGRFGRDGVAAVPDAVDATSFLRRLLDGVEVAASSHDAVEETNTHTQGPRRHHDHRTTTAGKRA